MHSRALDKPLYLFNSKRNLVSETVCDECHGLGTVAETQVICKLR